MAEDIVVVGGGVAGLATALALHREGLKSLLLERADSLRTAGAAFIMWPNAWKALHSLGVAHALRPPYSLLHGIRGCSNCTGIRKDLQLKRGAKGGSSSGKLECRCIERMAVLEALAKQLPDDSIRFNSKVVSLYRNTASPFTTLELADGTSFTAKIVIGCDGVHSVVAKWMGFPAAKSVGRVAIRGMVTYPHSHHFENLMVQIWGKGVRVGFIPCTDKQVYWFITRRSQPQDAEICGDAESVRGTALEMVRDFPEPIAELIKSSPAETINLAEMKVRWLWPWKKRGRGSVTIAGDALHPMTPDLGQGACLALEDAVLVGRCLGEAMKTVNMVDWGEAEVEKIEACLNKYLQDRMWRVSAIVSAAFIIGIVQEGSSNLTRFVRDWIFFPLFSLSYLLYFAAAVAQALEGRGNPLSKNGDPFVVGALGKDAQLLKELKFCIENPRVKTLVPSIATPQGLVDELGDGHGRKILCPVPSVMGLDEPSVVPDFLMALHAKGWDAVRLDAYVTRWAGPDCAQLLLGMRKIDAIVFTSTAEVQGVLKSLCALGIDWKMFRNRHPMLLVAAHGPVTASGAHRLGVQVDVVSKQFHSFAGVVDALASSWDSLNKR